MSTPIINYTLKSEVANMLSFSYVPLITQHTIVQEATPVTMESEDKKPEESHNTCFDNQLPTEK